MTNLMFLALITLAGSASMFFIAFISSFTDHHDNIFDYLDLGLKAAVVGLGLLVIDNVVNWLISIYS